MSTDEGRNRNKPRPLRPFPERPLERTWPSPTPGIPTQRKEKQDRLLRQVLSRLTDIEKRLERIEKLLGKRSL